MSIDVGDYKIRNEFQVVEILWRRRVVRLVTSPRRGCDVHISGQVYIHDELKFLDVLRHLARFYASN